MGAMTILLLFALLAGAATALTPCVLPVLPALLSAGATGGRRRPLGIVIGLTITHTFTIVALASLIDGVGLADGLVRALAIVVLLAFGVALAVPVLSARLEAPLSRLARFGPTDRGSGFRSGLLVGAALGFVYAPCAGPILAAVISVAATGGASGEIVAVALAYGLGSAAVLFLLAYGGVGWPSACAGPAAGRRYSGRSARSWPSPPWPWRWSSTFASRPRWPATPPTCW